MILQNMTPEEKMKQTLKLRESVPEIAIAWAQRNERTMHRTKTFPQFYTFDRDVPGMGKWTMVVTAECKSSIRKGIFAISAYQTFHVPYAKDKKNIGTGIYLFEGNDNGDTLLYEFSPHYFLRFRQRFVEPKGITQPSFPSLVKMMLKEHFQGMDRTTKGFKAIREDDGKVHIVPTDEYDRYSGYDNLISFTPNGLSLGMSSCGRKYYCYTTFVGNDDLYEDQLREQQEMMKERQRIGFLQRNDPFKVDAVRSKWITEDGKVLSEWK